MGTTRVPIGAQIMFARRLSRSETLPIKAELNVFLLVPVQTRPYHTRLQSRAGD